MKTAFQHILALVFLLGFGSTKLYAMDSFTVDSKTVLVAQHVQIRTVANKNPYPNLSVDNFGGRAQDVVYFRGTENRHLDYSDINDLKIKDPSFRLTVAEKMQLKALGAFKCEKIGKKGYWGTGFFVNLDKYKSKYDQVIASVSHNFFAKDDMGYGLNAGEYLGPCYFYSITDPSKKYEIALIYAKSQNIKSWTDEDDYAFVVLKNRVPGVKTLKLSFEDVYDYNLPEKARIQFITGNLNLKKMRIYVGLNCKPDDKKRYPYFKKWVRRYSKFVIGDCGHLGGGSGGPLMRRTSNGLKVIAINSGEHSPGTSNQQEELVYNPNASPPIFNYFRKLDSEVEDYFLNVLGVRGN